MFVTSFTGIVTRLDAISKLQGLGSHRSPNDTAYYITSDMFYLEIILKSSGEVMDVRVAHHGEAPVISKELTELLRARKFEDFSEKLEGLCSLYNIAGDRETKIKVFSALQSLEADLMKMSQFPRQTVHCDSRLDTVLNGSVGNLTPRQEGKPMTVEYFVSPYDQLEDPVMHGRFGEILLVTVEGTSLTYRLPISPLLVDSMEHNDERVSLFPPLDDAVSMELPACFFLKFAHPLPVLSILIERLQSLTGISINMELHRNIFFELLIKTVLKQRKCEIQDMSMQSYFLQSLPGDEVQSYILSQYVPGNQKGPMEGVLLSKIPFSHPEQVPAILEVLRHQCAFNTLLSSCISTNRSDCAVPGARHFEVYPSSDMSFCITFEHPTMVSLATVIVNVVSSRHIHGTFYKSEKMEASMDDFISRVLQRCMSIPVTMRAICRKMHKLKSDSLVEAWSPCQPEAATN
ncbi:mediator of RNA polymerase II transcription subunit 1 isoform X2 [Polypterus senegalus]|uniref:mediator of RNA polymerase II transcription subunit 1 isoform X2 n=1 Tax=Polypterus senegalus TaxID=55291 RepID=UPI001963D2F7|nr:mediator of RNA polymerase II transcription subunit 1 isoform X2 [Polypterus senegalus]